MALQAPEMVPVNIGAVADDGTGDKNRVAFEKLNSNDAALAETMAAILKDADGELDTFRKVANIIYVWNTIIGELPTPEQVISLIKAEAAPAVAAIPTPATVTAMITAAAAGVVAELSPTNFYTKSAVDALLAALQAAADAARATQQALIDANTAAIGGKPDLALVHAMTLAR